MTDITTRLSTALAGRYKLERHLGEGGMATVHLAHDLKHDRKVALKVLKPELAAILGAARFLNEIKVTANLQHSNILPLYDSGEADSFLYYVMPFVEGESLREKLNQDKQLSVEETVEIARGVASALDYAHEQGIVHRDIKPENILLQRGQALVADFGIALAVSAAGGTRLTETGLSLGTPHYMSPEQAIGDRELDARSDVYSLGAIVYEMLVGDPPYLGSSAQAIIAKILSEKPSPISQTRDMVPGNVEAAILRALAKSPADRFPNAAKFSDALTNPAFTLPVTGAPAADATSPGSSRKLSGALAVAMVAVTVIAAWGWLRPAPSTLSPTRFMISAPAEQEWLRTGRAALSPQGKHLVYAAGGGRLGSEPRLYRRGLDEFEAVPIAGTEGGVQPFFSPDGQWVGFWSDGALRKVLLDGGPPVTIVEAGVPMGAAWTTDGRIVYSELLSGLQTVSAAGGGHQHC